MTRRFYLQRNTDVSGVSGTGIVADGVEFPDGTTVVRWLGENQSTVVWATFASARAVHGHGGATEFVWLDPAEDNGDREPAEEAAPAPTEKPGMGLVENGRDPWQWPMPVQVRLDVLRELIRHGSLAFGPSLAAEVVELSDAILEGALAGARNVVTSHGVTGLPQPRDVGGSDPQRTEGEEHSE